MRTERLRSQKMKVTIYGPGTRSESMFRVHSADCQDNRKEDDMGNPPITVEAETRRSVVEFMYDGQLAEGADYDACRDDFEFLPCCRIEEEVAS
jgi:hypothetical protein